MAERGGSSTIAGVEYEQWVFVYYMSELIFSNDDNCTITPQKVREKDPLSQDLQKKVFVDDLVIDKDGETFYCTIKQHSPTATWNVSQLKSNGVISDIKKQFESNPNGKIRIISQSDSLIIRELKRLKGFTTRNEIQEALGSTNLIKEWDELVNAFEFDQEKMLKLALNLDIFLLDSEVIEQTVSKLFSLKFNVPEWYMETLFAFSFSRSVSKLLTSRTMVLDYLSKKGIVEKSRVSLTQVLDSVLNSTINLEEAVSPYDLDYIDRKEVQKVLDWVNSPRNRKENASKLLTVTGKAGMGKTTILQKVLLDLKSQNIPVLAIKADKIDFRNSEELKDLLRLPDTIDRVLSLLSDSNPLTVLLIDQIDALSLALSTNRSLLNRYKDLIAFAHRLPNVLVILSCRTYDLNNDLELKQYGKNEIIEVKSLEESEVIDVIKQLGIEETKLSKETLSVLITPLHLAIFVELFKSDSQIDLNFSSLRELYDKLWERKISKSENRQKLADLIGSVSNTMYTNQTLKINRAFFDLDYYQEIKYLFSEGIFQGYKNDISFFHQTFFDYSLARHFVASGKKISEELLIGDQGLYQRPRIKAVLEYQQQANEDNFLKECNTILFDSKYRVHIKYLIINLIGFLEFENVNYKAIGKKLLNDNNLQVPFLKSILSASWIRFLIDSPKLDITNDEIQEGFFDICNTNGRNYPNFIIELITKYESDLNQERLVHSLSLCVDVKNPDYLRMYKSYMSMFLSWDYRFYVILQAALNDREYNFFADEIDSFSTLKLEAGETKMSVFSSMFYSLFERLWDESPPEAYRASKKLFFIICEQSESKYQRSKYIECDAYSSFNGLEVESGDEQHKLYIWIVDYLCEKITNKELHLDELNEYLLSKYQVSICIGLEVMIRLQIANNGYSFLNNPDLWEEYRHLDDLFQYLVGELISVSYPLLSDLQQEEIYQNCNTLKDWATGTSWVSDKKTRNYWMFEDRYKLISKIPVEFINKSPERKKQLNEYKRRFKDLKWDRPSGPRATLSSGSIPLPEAAYKSMSIDDLRESFVRINNNRFSRSVSLYGHAEAFKKLCINEPKKYFPLLENMVISTPGNQINPIYTIYGILGFFESKYDFNKAIKLLHSIIEKASDFERESYYLLTIISDCLERGFYDDNMFGYLKNLIITHCKEKDESHIHTIDHLLNWVRVEPYQSKVFEIIETISASKNTKMKLYLLRSLSRVGYVDDKRTFDIFLKLMYSLRTVEKYSNARYVIQYTLYDHFKEIKPIILQGLKKIKEEQILQWYGQLVGIIWINDLVSTPSILNKAEIISEEYKDGILDISISVLKDKPKDSVPYKKAMEIVEKYLNESNEKLYTNYQALIRSINRANFLDYFDFLIKYVHSNVRNVANRSGDFVNKLHEVAAQFPDECIILCEQELKSPSFINQLDFYSRDKSIFDVLVKAYNALPFIGEEDKRQKVLDMIDRSLEIVVKSKSHYLTETFSILAQNESD
jgi:broad-specificity NMP kinase